MRPVQRKWVDAPAPSEGSHAPLLACRDLRKCFGSTVALRGVAVDVREGEIVALTGESGSGKSTLLLCLAGILLPDGGDVRFRGRSLGGLSDRERTALRRTEFGFVFQLGHLVADLPALVNVALPLMLNGVSRRRAEERARAWLDHLGIEGIAHRRPAEMSVGQAQRVAVARALVTEPSVVFADEPTGALDSSNAAVVVDMLVRAARERGTSVLLATHSPTVAAVADRAVLMRDGAIVGGKP